MPTENPFAHKSWLGQLLPEHEGLVVSATALTKLAIVADANVEREQAALLGLLAKPVDVESAKGVREFRSALERGQLEDEELVVRDLGAFTVDVLGWRASDLVADDSRFVSFLHQYDDTLRATHYVPGPGDSERPLLLVRVEATHTELDRAPKEVHAGWVESPERRFERLLRDTGVGAGLLFNGVRLRLVYAPKDETPGHISFPLPWLCSVSGRPMLAGLLSLLRQDRLFVGEPVLPRILAESRKAQNEVSTALGEQVLDALHLLVAGLQAANDADPRGRGELLREALREDPLHIYGGLVTVLLRLVFLLYAEDRGLLSSSPIFGENYAVGSLFSELQSDAGLYAGHMHKRFGAWARLLTLFRMLHDGAAPLELLAREGRLFDPDGYPFLEGRPLGTRRGHKNERIAPPLVSDGVVYDVLTKLRYLAGERLSYSTLDVEQIGSIYEGMMGFTLGETTGRSVAVAPHDVVVDLGKLLAANADDRVKSLAAAGCKPADSALKALKAARTELELLAALGKRVTRGPLAPGTLFLQPTEERRRTGSHYTPRALTSPIVERTLGPQLERLAKEAPGGEVATPAAILALKVCDPAMGSGAFLVEACRFLAAALVSAWDKHGGRPEIPLDETAELHARRVVAQRCLYGVDKNPFAVDLAKLSLWLFTLAKEHPFTFIDHALRHGDSLVGLSREQIAAFDWKPSAQTTTIRPLVATVVRDVEEKRAGIHALGDSNHVREKAALLRDADDALEKLRAIADLCLLAFFCESKDKAREKRRLTLAARVAHAIATDAGWFDLRDEAMALARLVPQVATFHWEIEFPEVFSRENQGFDCFVGNPPFAGKNTTIAANGAHYIAYLLSQHAAAHGNSDLVAHFFRRAFGLLRAEGTLGLIATNTIAQGDTRATGLRWILKNKGIIYHATRRFKWPGLAAVIVTILHLAKASSPPRAPRLDGRGVDRISAFLFHQGGDEDPAPLAASQGRSFQGSILLGMGFTFDDNDKKGKASPLAEMRRLIEQDSRNAERIYPYLGGEELNGSPTHAPNRFVINFGQLTEAEARSWPDLMRIVEARVKPERLIQKREIRARYWWRFGEVAPALYDAIRGLSRVLVCGQTSKYRTFSFVRPDIVYDQKLVVFAFEADSAFAIVQSSVHVFWAIFFGSTLEDRPVYTPSDCFETFPFPHDWRSNRAVAAAGVAYYEHRAALMVNRDEGLTETYNRFHDPNELGADILKLRELQAAMDRSVLDAYGWYDVLTTCDFILEYALEEDEPGKRGKKKPWRYRWPDEVREDVLARLILLNRERAEEERRQGLVAARRPDDAEDPNGEEAG